MDGEGEFLPPSPPIEAEPAAAALPGEANEMTTLEATADKRRSWLDRGLDLGVSIRLETLAYIALVVLAVVTRFYDLETRVMSHDESLHTYYSWELEQGRGFQHTPLMHGPFQFHMVALSYFLFGDSDASARVPAAVSGVLAIGILVVFRRWLGRTGALVAAALMLISPYMLYYSRYVRNEAFVVLEALLFYWAMFRYYETRQHRWLYLLAVSMSLHFATKETAFIYTAQALLFLGGLLVWRAANKHWEDLRLRRIFMVGATLSAAGMAFALVSYFNERGKGADALPEALQPLDPGAAIGPGASLSSLIAIGGLIAVIGIVILTIPMILEYGRNLRAEFPSLDLLLVIGTLTVPHLGAFPATVLGWDPLAYQDPVSFNRTVLVVILLFLVSGALGVLWDWRRWLPIAGAFYLPFVLFYTTFFTNSQGLATGLVGSLGYWLVQHGVERGSQPAYYYALIQIPFYEYLPAIGAALAFVMGLGLRRSDRSPAAADRGIKEEHPSPARFPAVLFIGYWAFTSFLGYSFAGERMPWLTVHIALPLILLAGWSLGKILDSMDWAKFGRDRAWLAVVLMLVFLLASARTLGFIFGPDPPFQGSELDQLRQTTQFMTVVAVAVATAAIMIRIGQEWEFERMLKLGGVTGLGVLTLLTARTAFRAAYVNYDNPTEFMVYAHSATGVKLVLSQIEDLSMRTTDGLGIKVAFDDDVSWPINWYLRNYPEQLFYGPSPSRDLLNYPVVIAGDNNWAKVDPLMERTHQSFEYIRMWWPMQDYFGLTWERISNAIFSPELRSALWEIWLNRDYTAYGEVVGTDFSLDNWVLADRMKLYIRTDVAALIWDYGITPTEFEPVEYVDPYAELMESLEAELILGGSGGGPGQFSGPRGLAIAPDGSIYIADTMNHRIQHLSPQGEVLAVWGEPSDEAALAGSFNEPWDVAVGPDGSVYVADTWNHRVQRFSAEGEFLGSFGSEGQAESPTSFWGPRGVAVDENGRVFVADTGNKRVVVFDSSGNALASFGGFGITLGGLDEPVGLAIGDLGMVYVADTWNQRISVFQEVGESFFEAVAEWPIDGWFGQSLDNKPYLAVGDEGMICASDPEGYRVLCFDPDGEFSVGWGGYGTSDSQFGLPMGLAFDPEGNLWVVDGANDRLMRFGVGGQ